MEMRNKWIVYSEFKHKIPKIMMDYIDKWIGVKKINNNEVKIEKIPVEDFEIFKNKRRSFSENVFEQLFEIEEVKENEAQLSYKTANKEYLNSKLESILEGSTPHIDTKNLSISSNKDAFRDFYLPQLSKNNIDNDFNSLDVVMTNSFKKSIKVKRNHLQSKLAKNNLMRKENKLKLSNLQMSMIKISNKSTFSDYSDNYLFNNTLKTSSPWTCTTLNRPSNKS